MNIRPEYLIGITILVIIVVISLFHSSTQFSPYEENSHLSQNPYEGFTQKVNYSTFGEEQKKNNDDVHGGLVPVQYTDYNNNDSIPYGGDGTELYANPSEDMNEQFTDYSSEAGDADEAVRVEGFGLQSSPYKDELLLDRFSQDEGSLACDATPYSNSKGYLCMDDAQIQLLKTRGGNQTGSLDRNVY